MQHTFLFQNLDRLIWSAAEVQRRIPIEPSRLQTLMKRHFPQSEAAQPETGLPRRSYTGRMIIWLALTNELMNMGISAGIASDMTAFSFMGQLDNDYKILAAGTDAAELQRISKMIVTARPISPGEERPAFGLAYEAPQGGSFITLSIGWFVMMLAIRFEADYYPPPV